MYDLKKFHTSVYTDFDTDKKADDFLVKLFIDDEEEAKKHQKIEGYIRYPQDVPQKYFKDVWKENEPHTTVCGKYSKSRGEWHNALRLTRAMYRGNTVKCADVFGLKFEVTDDPNSNDGQATWKEFVNEMRDFLDYIVKLISEDESNKINIDMVTYAEHPHLANGNPEFWIMYRIEAEGVDERGKKQTVRDSRMLQALFEMYHEFCSTLIEKGK